MSGPSTSGPRRRQRVLLSHESPSNGRVTGLQGGTQVQKVVEECVAGDEGRDFIIQREGGEGSAISCDHYNKSASF